MAIVTERFFAVTLFVDDLTSERQWYADVFGMPVVDESDESCTFRFPDDVYINLNARDAAAHHVLVVPEGSTPARSLLTLQVDDVDAAADRLALKGVQILKPPTTEPWGSRSMTFADSSGNYWEFFSRP